MTGAVHPSVAAIARALYGESVEPADFAKSVDPSDVHMDQVATKATGRRKKIAAGLLAGAGIEALAAKDTLAPLAEGVRDLKPVVRAARGAGKVKALKPLVAGPAGKHLPVTRGPGLNAALQSGNFAVGVGAAKELVRPKKQLAKGLPRVSLKPLNPAQARRVVTLKARRPAGSPVVSKGTVGNVKTVAANAEQITGKVAKLIPKRKTAIVGGVGLVTASGAALGAGTYEGAKHGVQRGLRKALGSTELDRALALHLQVHRAAGPVPKALNDAYRGAVHQAVAKHGVEHVARHLGYRKFAARSAAAARPVRFAPKSRVTKAAVDIGEISKMDTDLRQVFGWASISKLDGEHVVDRQDDIIPIEELEKAAYDYVQTSRVGADQHRRISKNLVLDVPRQTATLIESMVFTPEKISKMGLPPDFPQGWFIGMQIEDEPTWQAIKRGERTGFSLHGLGRRTPLELTGFGKADDSRTRRAMRVAGGVAGAVPGAYAGLVPGTVAAGATFRHKKTRRSVGEFLDSAPEHETSMQSMRRAVKTSGGRRALGATGVILAGSAAGAYGGYRGGKAVVRRVQQRHDRLAKADDRTSLQDPTHSKQVAQVVNAAASSRGVRTRLRQAKNPPPVRRESTPRSSMASSAGYQRQTRKLDVEMRSRPGEPYSYRVRPKQAQRVLSAPSLGRAYTGEIRNKAKRHTRYTVGDRTRLLLDPVS